MDLEEIKYAEYDVACRTKGCPADGEVLTIQAEDTESPSIYCGACSQPITDIKRN